MCFLPQTSLLLLFLRFFRALLQRLACLPHGALHSLRCFCFGYSSRHAICRGAVMLRHSHDDMARALLIPEAPAHWRRTHALPPRPLVHGAVRHVERIHIERLSGIISLALGIGDGAAQGFFYFLGHTLFRKAQSL